MSAWIFIGHSFENDPFELEGVDVWRTWQATGERAKITDPLYHWQNYEFPVYSLIADGKIIEFAAGEFSNNVWGFFQRKP